MNRTLAGILELASVLRTSVLELYVTLQKRVVSGSEIFTHPTENVQKTNSFFSQKKIIYKFTSLKNQQIYYFVKGKLFYLENPFTGFTLRVTFSTTVPVVNIQQLLGTCV